MPWAWWKMLSVSSNSVSGQDPGFPPHSSAERSQCHCDKIDFMPTVLIQMRYQYLSSQQCCGSGSVRIHNYLQDPDPELLISDPDPTSSNFWWLKLHKICWDPTGYWKFYCKGKNSQLDFKNLFFKIKINVAVVAAPRYSENAQLVSAENPPMVQCLHWRI